MMTEMAVPPAVDPNIRVMNSAARSRLEERMTALGTAAKKAMLTSMSAERERKRERESGSGSESESESVCKSRTPRAVRWRRDSQITETRSIAMGAARLTVLMGDLISDME